MYHGERLNSITHLVGTALAVAGAAVLIARVVGQDDPWKITGVVLFGLGLIVLYAASTLYHAVRGRLKPWLRRADHAAVFLLIACTWAPFALGPLRDGFGPTLLCDRLGDGSGRHLAGDAPPRRPRPLAGACTWSWAGSAPRR